VDQLGRKHRTGGTDRMPMRNGAAFHIDDVLGHPKLPGDNNRNRCEGFIYLGALDGANVPTSAQQ
jgi:hypothetical protein